MSRWRTEGARPLVTARKRARSPSDRMAASRCPFSIPGAFTLTAVTRHRAAPPGTPLGHQSRFRPPEPRCPLRCGTHGEVEPLAGGHQLVCPMSSPYASRRTAVWAGLKNEPNDRSYSLSVSVMAFRRGRTSAPREESKARARVRRPSRSRAEPAFIRNSGERVTHHIAGTHTATERVHGAVGRVELPFGRPCGGLSLLDEFSPRYRAGGCYRERERPARPFRCPHRRARQTPSLGRLLHVPSRTTSCASPSASSRAFSRTRAATSSRHTRWADIHRSASTAGVRRFTRAIDATINPHKQFIFSSAGLTVQTLLDETLLDVPHARGSVAGPFERGLLAGGIGTVLFYITLGRSGSVSDVTFMANTSSLSKTQVSLIYGGMAALHVRAHPLQGSVRALLYRPRCERTPPRRAEPRARLSV